MFEVILLGVALAMDSLAVSIANGIKYMNYSRKKMFASSFSFGFFQGAMPLLSYLFLLPFISYIERIDHWLVLIILSLIGSNMIREGLEKEEIKGEGERFTYRILLAESIATAIDALSVGVTLPSFPVNPFLSCLIIFICTFIICLIGHLLGKRIALLLKDKAIILGGIVLILIGIKTVLEHLHII